MTTDTHKKPASWDAEREEVKATHWMDSLGRVCTDEFMRSPAAHSDYQMAYNIPCVKRRGKYVPIGPAIDRMRYLDELETARKCDCTFLCKFCRERRDELEKGHE